MTRIPIQPKIKKVSQIVMDQNPQSDSAPAPSEQQHPTNEFGEIVADQTQGLDGYASEIIANLKLAIKFAESQLSGLEKVLEQHDDSVFAERLPGPENSKWWEKKSRESAKIKKDILTFLPLLPQTVEEKQSEVPETLEEPEDVSGEML